jgi:hypothetical protein
MSLLLSERTFKTIYITQIILLFILAAFASLAIFIMPLQTIEPYVILSIAFPSIPLIIVIALESAARMDEQDKQKEKN